MLRNQAGCFAWRCPLLVICHLPFGIDFIKRPFIVARVLDTTRAHVYWFAVIILYIFAFSGHRHLVLSSCSRIILLSGTCYCSNEFSAVSLIWLWLSVLLYIPDLPHAMRTWRSQRRRKHLAPRRASYQFQTQLNWACWIVDYSRSVSVFIGLGERTNTRNNNHFEIRMASSRCHSLYLRSNFVPWLKPSFNHFAPALPLELEQPNDLSMLAQMIPMKWFSVDSKREQPTSHAGKLLRLYFLRFRSHRHSCPKIVRWKLALFCYICYGRRLCLV